MVDNRSTVCLFFTQEFGPGTARFVVTHPPKAEIHLGTSLHLAYRKVSCLFVDPSFRSLFLQVG